MNDAALMETVFVFFYIRSRMLTVLTGLLPALLKHSENEGNGLEHSLFVAVAEEVLGKRNLGREILFPFIIFCVFAKGA